MDIVGWLGTLATFAFIYSYMATSLSAGKMLAGAKLFTASKKLIVATSMLVLAVALLGSLYPVPPKPYNLLPWIFGAYMVLGVVWCWRSNSTQAAKTKAENIAVVTIQD